MAIETSWKDDWLSAAAEDQQALLRKLADKGSDDGGSGGSGEGDKGGA